MQRCKQRRGDTFRRDVLGAAVHDAVADRRQPGAAKMLAGEAQQGFERGAERVGAARWPALLRKRGPVRVSGEEMRRAVQVLDLTPHRRRLGNIRPKRSEQGELEAGRPGVQRQDRPCHACAP